MVVLTSREIEKRRRINVALWSFAYAVMNDPIVPDNVYDVVATSVNLKGFTDNIRLDIWFENNFRTSTCAWIWSHPDFEKIAQMYYRLNRGKIRKVG